MKTLRTLLTIAVVCALLLVSGCALLPSILHTLNPGVIYRVPNAEHTLFLTLDDGPSDATPLILEVLMKHDVHATFFVITDHIQPALLGRIISEGHQIAHHMKTSASLGRLSDVQFQEEFLAADKALTAFPHAKFFRPPGGSISKERADFVHAQGYQIVVGTVFPLDHWLENKTLVEGLIKALVVDGGIIILHDTPTRGPRTAAVLDELLPQLKQKGYRFALLPEPKP